MAKRNRGRSADTSDIANALPSVEPFESALLRPVQLPDVTFSRLDEYLSPDPIPYDRRSFTFGEPEPYTLVTATPVSPGPIHRETIGFGRPDEVAVCYRRKARREVLFAKKRTRGRGGSRRRTWRSDVKC